MGMWEDPTCTSRYAPHAYVGMTDMGMWESAFNKDTDYML